MIYIDNLEFSSRHIGSRGWGDKTNSDFSSSLTQLRVSHQAYSQGSPVFQNLLAT